MNKNDAELVAKNRAMSVAFRESILEASEEELRQALRDEGRDLDEEAARAQDVIERAFQQAGVALPTTAQESAGVPLEDIQRSESRGNEAQLET